MWWGVVVVVVAVVVVVSVVVMMMINDTHTINQNDQVKNIIFWSRYI